MPMNFYGGGGSSSVVAGTEPSVTLWRGNATTGVAPTLTEYGGAANAGAVALVKLTDGKTEVWTYDGAAFNLQDTRESEGAEFPAGLLAVDTTHTAAEFVGNTYSAAYDTSGAARTATLPSGLPDGSEFTASRVGGNDLTVVGSGGETIVTDATGVTLNQPGWATFRKSGTDWQLVAYSSA